MKIPIKHMQEWVLPLIIYRVHLDMLLYNIKQYRFDLNHILFCYNLRDNIISLDIDILSDLYFYKGVLKIQANYIESMTTAEYIVYVLLLISYKGASSIVDNNTHMSYADYIEFFEK